LAGQVDHGKTTLLDKIRGTSVAKREPGQITQWIGASLLPTKDILEIYGETLQKFKFKVEIPGLLFIDTPGHESFSNLRRRGGSAADIAILVIDLNEGVQPQTEESLEILKTRRTPFVIAANKIDAVPGWKKSSNEKMGDSYRNQSPETQREIDNKIYSMMGSLSKFGFNSDRFDRIKDFTKTIAIIPTSAKTGEGIQELLAIVVGLTEAFMKKKLITTQGPAKGTVLEVKEETGLGTTINAIIYDGILNVDDKITLGGKDGPIITNIRAILVPKPLDEIRDPRDKFSNVDNVKAAAGIKIVAPELEKAIAGSSIYSVPSNKSPEDYTNLVKEEFQRVRIETDKIGVVLKTDTLGALEAIIASLANSGIAIRLADVGDISKRDIIETEIVREKDPVLGVVLGFNVKLLPDAKEEAAKRNITIIQKQIIYDLLDGYMRWAENEKTLRAKMELDKHIRPGKIHVLSGFVFRHSKPAIFGVEILGGTMKKNYPLMNKDGKKIGVVLRLQDKGQDIDQSTTGMQVAVSVDKAVMNRNIFENDILYTSVPEHSARELSTRLRNELRPDELQILDEITKIMRKRDPLWKM
jgi:translation initiation factor 5B